LHRERVCGTKEINLARREHGLNIYKGSRPLQHDELMRFITKQKLNSKKACRVRPYDIKAG